MKTIILNHKMNLQYEELNDYIERINKIDKDLIIAPSNIYLIEFINKCKHKIASQDICYIEDGNYTGKVSWRQMQSLGIKYSIIGHSEKKDSNEKVNTKLSVALDNKITPILCFGNQTKEENIIETLSKLEVKNINNIIFAYEPIFNIANSKIDIQYIKEQINSIYDYLLNKYNEQPTILYGGGINKDNIKEIYNIEKIKGILLGSISSDIEEIEKLLININNEK